MSILRDFFVHSSDGQEFVKSLYVLIDQEHQRAEAEANSARDHTQKAKGIRIVIDEIKRKTALKKGETDET